MSVVKTLIWKEWRETQPLLWIALGVFVGLPVIGGIEALGRHPHHFEIATSGWVFFLGGLFAVIVGVGMTCRDLDENLEDFWRSRPASPVQWMLVKYLLGLGVVLIACTLPLLLEMLINRETNTGLSAAWFPFLWATSFSAGFCAGCLVRKMTHAVMLALAALLLIYYLPSIYPPLGWMNFAVIPQSWLQQNWLQTTALKFAAAMSGLTIVFLFISLWVVERGWWIESGQKLIYATFAIAILVLAASAAYRLGNNLPILQEIDLKGNYVRRIEFHGSTGYAEIADPTNDSRSSLSLRRIDLTPTEITLGSRVNEIPSAWRDAIHKSLRAPHHPQTEYVEFYPGHSFLQIFDNGKFQRQIPIFKNEFSESTRPAFLAWDTRLYALGESHLVIWDISEPDIPKLISIGDFHYDMRSTWEIFDDSQSTLLLPEIPGLPAQQRLEIALKKLFGLITQQDEGKEVIVELPDDAVGDYRVTHLTDTRATFQRIGEYQRSFLERMFSGYGQDTGKSMNGLLYLIRGAYGNYVLNPGVTILELNGKHPMRDVGHFAVPGMQIICPLPDGRAVVGGAKIWLIGPPPHHD